MQSRIPNKFLSNTYAGLAYKVGGGLIARFDLVHGGLVRLDAPHVLQEFQILNIQIGAVLGGGAGAVVVFVFNCPHVVSLNNKDVGAGSWSLDLNIGVKLNALFTNPKYARFLSQLARYGIENLDDIVTLRNVAWDAYSAMACSLTNDPAFVTFGIPGAGAGAQVSVAYCITGRFEYLKEYVDSGARNPDRGEPGYDGAHGRGNY